MKYLFSSLLVSLLLLCFCPGLMAGQQVAKGDSLILPGFVFHESATRDVIIDQKAYVLNSAVQTAPDLCRYESGKGLCNQTISGVGPLTGKTKSRQGANIRLSKFPFVG